MTAALDLFEAANLAPQNLRVKWEADTLQSSMIAFWQQALPSFAEETPNDHPIINWLSIIASFSPSILLFNQVKAPGSSVWYGGTIETFSQAVDFIYRICKFGFEYTLITPTQKTALLAAYNANFA